MKAKSTGLRCTRLEDRTTPASFQGLGDLAGGAFASFANSVSADGITVVGLGTVGSGQEAFRWTATNGMIGVGDLAGGSFYSRAAAASVDGSVIVGSSSSTASGNGDEAFRWTAADGMVGLGHLPGGNFPSDAYGVSADGSVVVGTSVSAPGYQAFRWTATGGMLGLGDLPGGFFFSSAVGGVSADGSAVAGSSSSASGTEAFRWTSAGGMVGLGDLAGGGFYSEADAISADGLTVVGYSASNASAGGEAFRWTAAGGMVGLGALPGGDMFSQAFATSANGSVVVGASDSAAASLGEAFLWTASSGMRSLRNVLVSQFGLGSQLSGWTLDAAYGCSPDGRTIVGIGTDPASNIEAWLAHLDAPPQVAATQVNDGSAQRSRVTSLTIRFDSQVTFAGAVADAFTLSRIGGGAVSFAASASVVNDVTVVTLNNFTGNDTQFGSIVDGRYMLTALASQISANGQQMTSNYTFGDAQGLFRLFGDVNGDQAVNGFDLGLFRNAFGTQSSDPNYLRYLDINGDGVINGFDLGQFRTRFGTMLP